ncbi:protein-disulfide reductase DsbD family protein [Mucilaginibacter boryungensis]|uniref:Thioredoxin family protein n=1 Tax=Mucilaginibacter boryungensis TaxID=768480 RepID=A0ABR9XL67_9SPHI|nr:thioredoxin family protein [Mucilaginibacter boryungensis]MBE9668138.1 thioredoxin family protein [Mucilaginibacter boryungensis]
MSLSLFAIFLSGMAGGFAATLMPCIFPMLPLTVSYFTKTTTNRSKAVNKAMLYGLSIIVIYVLLGLAVTVLFGADALNSLSTNGIFNFLFFIILLAFAISLFGGFDINLPSKWVNRVDRMGDQAGIAGLFFMAATLALVSFSCTGPIVGTLLVQAAANGRLLAPAIGMFGFSLALALPFTIFALAPNALNALPRSGKWLVNFKVILGFLELALSLKFLSNVDLSYHYNLLDREVFLVLWITIAALLGFYLLGKLRFAYDEETKTISVPRLLLSIVVFSFTLYMIPGLWGAPLKSIAAFLPPPSSQDFNLAINSVSRVKSGTVRSPKKYEQLFKAPLGLDAFFEYDEGLAYAKKCQKPLLIDFTGHACVNCRKMEETVWPDKQVFAYLNEKFVLVQLYVDDKTPLSAGEQYTSRFSHKHIETLGQKWSDLQASKFNANSQPYYTILDDTGQLLTAPSGSDYDVSSFSRFLKKGIDVFKP